jgi:uncharacterized protein (DUF58 family)
MIDTTFLNQLDRFNLVVKKRVTSTFAGPRHSTAIGRGITFKDHRIYAPGDDFRSIDWKVFARTDDLYLKTYEEERNLVVHIIIDGSASMDFGKPISKFDYGAMLGVGFAYLAMKENEKFQFCTFSENLNVVQPRKGMAQVAAMVDYLNKFKIKGASQMKNSIYQYRKFIGSRAMIIFVSDFLVPIEEVREVLYMMGRNEIKIIQVLDPIEKELKLQGDFKLEDSETKEKLRAYISPRLRQHYQNLLEDHIGKIQDSCNRQGIDFYSLTTDMSIFDAFYKVIY